MWSLHVLTISLHLLSKTINQSALAWSRQHHILSSTEEYIIQVRLTVTCVNPLDNN